jgi:hypothetical protein
VGGRLEIASEKLQGIEKGLRKEPQPTDFTGALSKGSNLGRSDPQCTQAA